MGTWVRIMCHVYIIHPLASSGEVGAGSLEGIPSRTEKGRALKSDRSRG